MKPALAIPAITLLILRSLTNRSLTPLGTLVALLTAIAHAVHPWSVFFALLSTFFLTGTAVTKVKHDVKARLTLSSADGAKGARGGSGGGEGARTHVQVLANSFVASVLILLHWWKVRSGTVRGVCFPYAPSVAEGAAG